MVGNFIIFNSRVVVTALFTMSYTSFRAQATRRRMITSARAAYVPLHRGERRPSLQAQRRAFLAAGVAHSRRFRRSIAARTSPRGPAGDAKYIDIANADYDCDTTGSITHLSAVAQGTSVNKRDGKAFRISSAQIRGYVTNGSTAVVNDCAVFFVWDKFPNKVLPAITDILDSVHARAMNKRENASRFVILRRWDFSLTGKNDASTVPGFFRSFDHFVRFPKDCICTCTTADTTGDIDQRITGALYMVTVGSTAAGDAAALANMTIRVNFVDI